MMRTLSTWLILAVGTAALMAACGGTSTTTSRTEGSSSPAGPSGPVGGTAAGATYPSTPAAQRAAGKHAVASCKGAIHAQTSIAASAKAKLEAICGKAASGTRQALETVAHEECVALVNATPLPNAAAKQRALAICKVPA
ncbi:MAG TPA: hypothetical protein VEJ23_01190 [Solirubrobacteraceae bacterium]|nr:hypothetical protein [Solirubrobacteraceae bacterium]